MMQAITSRERATQLRMLSEHADLERRASELRELLDGVFDWLHMERMLAALEVGMLAHFDTEESGGYLKEVVEAAPHTQRQVDELLVEHDLMRGMLRQARHVTIEACSRDELRIILCEWLTLLDDHERRENLLALSVFSTDVGGGD